MTRFAKRLTINALFILGISVIVLSLNLSDFTGRKAIVENRYQNSAFKIGDPVTIEVNGQEGNVVDIICTHSNRYCGYYVNTFDGTRLYKIFLYEFELEKRQ